MHGVPFLNLWRLTVWAFFWCVPAAALAKPVAGRLVLQGRNVAEPGYVVSVDAQGVRFSASPTGAAARLYPMDRVAKVELDVPEGWPEARDLMQKGKFEDAGKMFDKIAEQYREVRVLQDGYGAMALFYAMECERISGNYAALNDQVPLLKEEYLSPAYRPQVRMFSLWAAYGNFLSKKEGIERLERLTDEISLQKMPGSQMAQAGFLEGAVKEAQGDISGALTGYHRAFTLDFAKDRELSQKAMEAALRVYLKDEDLAKNPARLREAHGLGKIYQELILGGGKAPDDIKRFTEPLPKGEETAS